MDEIRKLIREGYGLTTNLIDCIEKNNLQLPVADLKSSLRIFSYIQGFIDCLESHDVTKQHDSSKPHPK